MRNGRGRDGATAAELTVADVRAAIGQLLDAVEAQFGPDLRLRDDYYWNVPLGDAVNLDGEPVLDVGSVADDAISVREFLSRDDPRFVSIWHESDHIAGILRAIARLDAYPAAWQEWGSTGEASTWEPTTEDGLSEVQQ